MSRKGMEKIKKEYWEEEQPIFFKQSADGLVERILDPSFSRGNLIKNLYPEFKFESPYGTWLRDWRERPEEGIRVVDLFPFYRKIIVGIPPNPENESRGGLSIPQIIELYKNGFIFPIFTDLPVFYTSDIFKPLFEMKGQYHIPCNRIWLFLMGISSLGTIEAENEILEKYGQPNQINNKLKKYFSSFPGAKESNCRDMYRTFILNTCDLEILGGGSLVKRIFARVDDVGAAHFFTSIFRELMYPLMCLPGGYMNYNQKMINFYSRTAQLYEQFYGQLYEENDQATQEDIFDEKAIILPQDFLVELKERILYNAPRRVDDPLQFAYNLREYDCVEEHFRILKKLNDDFNEGKFRDALCITKNIREQVMPELNARIGEIQKGYKRIEYGITIGGTLLASLPALPLLQALTQGEIESNFVWAGSVGLHVLRAKYNERLSKFFTGLRFGRNILPYLIWRHEKEHGERGN